MALSDRIEMFILHLLSDEDEWIELKRNELAQAFDCVPSQINYVLSTRFTPGNGYITESRRGGGGYLRIRRLNSENIISSVISSIDDEIDAVSAQAVIKSITNRGLINEREGAIMLCAVSDNSLVINQPFKNRVRAEILKNCLIKLIEVIENDV